MNYTRYYLGRTTLVVLSLTPGICAGSFRTRGPIQS